MVAVVAVGACGASTAAGGGGGAAGDAEAAKIIAASQAIIGTSMVGGELQGDTIVITMVDGFGKGGAGLFMCSNIKVERDRFDPSGTFKMTMVSQSGEELANSTACK
jgi:hypothetical protein